MSIAFKCVARSIPLSLPLPSPPFPLPPRLSTFPSPFRSPRRPSASAHTLTPRLARREGLKLDGKVVDQLVQGSQSDIRQIINMLATYKLGAQAISFDQGKAL